MDSATLAILVALIIQVALGLAVMQSSLHRKSNQAFLILSGAITAWLACLYLISVSQNGESAAFYIRQASAAGALILLSFNLLRISVQQPRESWAAIFRESWMWTVSTAADCCSVPDAVVHEGCFVLG